MIIRARTTRQMVDQPSPSETPTDTSLPSTDAAPGHSALIGEASRTLHRRLARKDAENSGVPPPLAPMYLGAKIARLRADNPEYLSHAAHSMRELIDALPTKYPTVPAFDHADLVSRVRELLNSWHAYQAAPSPVEALARADFDQAMKTFAEEMDDVRTTHRERAGALIAAMDPSGRPLPPVIADLRVSEWATYRRFFLGACHHGSTTPEEFDGMLEPFEDFLIDRLGLRAFRNQAALERLIGEAEGT